MIRTTVESFWSRVEKQANGCWEWQGAVTSRGYGAVGWRGIQVSTHRLAFELVKGAIPQGLVVRHKCDNPPCVNPDHLELGTTWDNVQDAIQRGRANKAKGRQMPQAKLSELAVAEARQLRAQGMLYRELADRFGVTIGTIHHACAGNTWKHVQG